MSKAFKENYLTKQNGCKVIEVSSERQNSPASNIISTSEREIWIIDKKLPQYCVIDTSNLRNYPKVFNRVGFYCWHEYDTNPALIEVAYSNGFNEEWNIAGKIRLERVSDKQFFKIRDIPTTEMKQLKITLLQNFGDPKSTYINTVELGYVKQTGNIDSSRDKIYSDFMKLTSTQKELKRAQEQIKRLSGENEEIKLTLKKQGEMIIEMQHAFKTLTKELQKVQTIQQIQNQTFTTSEKIKEKEIDKLVDKKMNNRLNFGTHSSLSDSQRDQKKYIQDKMIHKKTMNLLSKNASQSYGKSHANSNKQSRQRIYDQLKNSKGGTIRQSKNQNHYKRDSESQLSQYLASDVQDQKSKYSQKCSVMIEKLQFLLKEKNRREKELKRKNGVNT